MNVQYERQADSTNGGENRRGQERIDAMDVHEIGPPVSHEVGDGLVGGDRIDAAEPRPHLSYEAGSQPVVAPGQGHDVVAPILQQSDERLEKDLPTPAIDRRVVSLEDPHGSVPFPVHSACSHGDRAASDCVGYVHL
jgi:hypothetical protein